MRVTRSKKALLAETSPVAQPRDEEDSTLRQWPAAPSPPARKKRRGKKAKQCPSTPAGPCWLALDTASLERVFELLLADPNGGKEACKAAGAACKAWRQACMDVVLSDTAASRPARPMPEDVKPSVSCAAAVWDGPKSEEEVEGFEASSQRRRAQARALLTTSTGRCAGKVHTNAAAAAAAGRRQSHAVAGARPRSNAAAATSEGAQRRQVQMPPLLFPSLPPLQARAGPSSAAATAADAQQAGSARLMNVPASQGQAPRAGAAWTSPWLGVARATRARRHRQQPEQQQVKADQHPSGEAAELDARTPVQPVQQRMPAHLHTQPSHRAVQSPASPSQQGPHQPRQTRQRRQQQQAGHEAAAASGPFHVDVSGGRSPSTNADSRSVPVKQKRVAKRGMRTRSQQPSARQTHSSSQEPSVHGLGQRRHEQQQEDEEEVVQRARADSAVGVVTNSKPGARADRKRKRRTLEEQQQQQQQEEPEQGQPQQDSEAERAPVQAHRQRQQQAVRMGWDSMPGATLLRGIFSRFTTRR